MSQNGTPSGENLPPMIRDLPLKGIESKLTSLTRQIKRLEEQLSPVQQMELISQPDLTQVIEDLQHLPKILQSLKTSLLGLEQRLTQIDEWRQSLSESSAGSPVAPETIQAQLQTLELLIQNFQDSLSQQKTLTAQVSQLEQQQRELTEAIAEGFSLVQEEMPRLANRFSPMQMWLNGKQLSLKTLVGMFLLIGVCQTIVAVPLLALFLSWQQMPVLERINGRVNNLEINQKKLLNQSR